MAQNESPIYFFWLCNHVPLFIGITIFFRSSFWLTAEISLLFIGSLNWSLDFLSKLIFDKYLLGSTAYIFAGISAQSATSILLHLSTLPLALLAFFIIHEKNKTAWKGSLLHMLILIPISFYFGLEYNLNCVLKSCVDWIPTFSFYPIAFLVSYFILFVLSINWVLNKLIRD
jgi:hypothetical protein